MNINRLKVEEWQAKTNKVSDLFLSIKADIIALQEVNVNWKVVLWKDKWEEYLIG